MILKGRSRGHGSQLARYLFHEKNDAVRVMDLRGTCAHELTSSGLIDALKEFDEYGKLTQGRKTIFHLAIAPSDHDRMTAAQWQYAVGKAERALGMEGQPRAVVMHTYEGKEHLHVAWSRVDLETHKLKSDSFTNLKLCNAARDIELELGLAKLPDIHRSHERAKRLTNELRAGATPAAATMRERKPKQREKEVKRFTERQGGHTKSDLQLIIAGAWHQASNGSEFQARLEQNGFHLARGDRGAMAVDREGNPYSPARYVEGVRVKDVNAKCRDVLDDLPTVDELQKQVKKVAVKIESEILLTPRKAAKLVRQRLKLDVSNDPMQTPRQVSDFEYD